MIEKTDKEKIQIILEKLNALSAQVDSLSVSTNQTAEYIDRKRIEIKARLEA